jgi:hypothetical protein
LQEHAEKREKTGRNYPESAPGKLEGGEEDWEEACFPGGKQELVSQNQSSSKRVKSGNRAKGKEEWIQGARARTKQERWEQGGRREEDVGVPGKERNLLVESVAAEIWSNPGSLQEEIKIGEALQPILKAGPEIELGNRGKRGRRRRPTPTRYLPSRVEAQGCGPSWGY